MKSLRIPFAVLGVAVLFSACATKVAGLKQSETFIYPSILTGKMVVGGVTSAVADIEESRRNSLGNLLRTELIEEHKEYPVQSVGMVTGKLGSQKYQQLISEYKNNGMISEPTVRMLKDKLNGTRYITFARIENDDVSQDRNDTHNTDSRGNIVPGSERVVTRSTRTVTVSMHIYDLQRAEEVWSGSVTKSANNTAEYQKDQELALVAIIRAAKGTDGGGADKYPYPNAPDSTKVLKLAFAGFAENLPKKD